MAHVIFEYLGYETLLNDENELKMVRKIDKRNQMFLHINKRTKTYEKFLTTKPFFSRKHKTTPLIISLTEMHFINEFFAFQEA